MASGSNIGTTGSQCLKWFQKSAGSLCRRRRIEAPEAPRSSAGGARIEAPKAPRGMGCGEGVSPSPPGVGSGEGAVPPPQKFF